MSKKKTPNIIENLEPEERKFYQRIKPSELGNFDPLTENQKKFYDAYERGDYFTMLSGSAGTGKSFIACYKAIQDVYNKDSSFKRIVLVRSAVQGREIGHTPGTVEDKLSLYEGPYHQIFHTLFNRRDAYDSLKEAGKIEFISTSFIRGMSFDDSIIIIDEIQNCDFFELNTVMTRIGYRSKIILCGDYKQNDLYRKSNDTSGLKKFHEIAKTMDSFTNIQFTSDDIVRSSLVRDWIVATEKYENTF